MQNNILYFQYAGPLGNITISAQWYFSGIVHFVVVGKVFPIIVQNSAI